MPIQERAQRTRRRVLVAAAGVFAQRGFARASMAEILDAAGVTKGALYFHFPGKEALAKAVVQEQFQNPGFAALDGDGADGDAEAGDPGEDGGFGPGAEPPLDLPPGYGGVQAVVDTAHAFARRLKDDPIARGAVRLAIEHGSFAEPDPGPYLSWIGQVAELLREARKRGELLPDVDIDQSAQVLVASFTGVQLVSDVLTHRADLESKVTAMWRMTLPGLVTESWLERIRPEGLRAAARQAAG